MCVVITAGQKVMARQIALNRALKEDVAMGVKIMDGDIALNKKKQCPKGQQPNYNCELVQVNVMHTGWNVLQDCVAKWRQGEGIICCNMTCGLPRDTMKRLREGKKERSAYFSFSNLVSLTTLVCQFRLEFLIGRASVLLSFI